jgi:hypothetical protein
MDFRHSVNNIYIGTIVYCSETYLSKPDLIMFALINFAVQKKYNPSNENLCTYTELGHTLLHTK